MLTRLRKTVDGWIKGSALSLVKLGVSPSTVTILGFCLSVVSAVFYAVAAFQGHIYLAAAFLFGSGFCDVLDGAMARIGNQSSSFGNFLDSLLDRYSDLAVLFAISIRFASSPLLGVPGYAWGFLAVTGSLLVSYTRAKADSLGVKLENVGLAERPERMIILIVFSVILHPEWAVFIIAILANITVIQRAIRTYSEIRGKT